MESRGLCECMLLQKPAFFTPRRLKSNILVIGAGTGLGECQLVWNGRHYQAWPSEGGHTSFSPENEEQIQVRGFLRRKYNLTQGGSSHISVERLCSGQGIQDIYEFMRWKFPNETDAVADAEFERAIEKAVVLTNYGRRKSGTLMNRALEMFLSIYGAEIGNAALKFLPFGGIYIGGGIAHNLKDYLQKSTTFLNAIRDKGRMSYFIRQMPIKLILSKGVAIRGAETVARRKLQAFLDESPLYLASKREDFSPQNDPNLAW